MKRTRALFPLAQNKQQHGGKDDVPCISLSYPGLILGLPCQHHSHSSRMGIQTAHSPFLLRSSQLHNQTVSPLPYYQYNHPLNPLVIQASCHIASHISTFSLIVIWGSANSVSDVCWYLKDIDDVTLAVEIVNSSQQSEVFIGVYAPVITCVDADFDVLVLNFRLSTFGNFGGKFLEGRREWERIHC